VACDHEKPRAASASSSGNDRAHKEHEVIAPFPAWALNGAACVLATAYFGFALLHVYWALGGRAGLGAAVPHEGGLAVIAPGRLATLAVALCLLACSALLLAWLRVIPSALSETSIRIGVGVLAAIMAARAIGDFRYVGLFRRRGEGQFAAMDTLLYTPMCIAFSVVLCLLATTR
jgi:hypothetical protein